MIVSTVLSFLEDRKPNKGGGPWRLSGVFGHACIVFDPCVKIVNIK